MAPVLRSPGWLFRCQQVTLIKERLARRVLRSWCLAASSRCIRAWSLYATRRRIHREISADPQSGEEFEDEEGGRSQPLPARLAETFVRGFNELF